MHSLFASCFLRGKGPRARWLQDDVATSRSDPGPHSKAADTGHRPRSLPNESENTVTFVCENAEELLREIQSSQCLPEMEKDLAFAAAKTANVAGSGYPFPVHELGPPRPPCEEERMETMAALGLTSAVPEPDPELDSILKLVTAIFEIPLALVVIFKQQAVFVKAGTAGSRGDMPWRWSFCGWGMWTTHCPQIMIVPDAQKDARLADNLHVSGPKGWLRFYAGAPLIAANGHHLGTLCFGDSKPREMDASRCAILNNFAEMIVRHLEKDMMLQALQSQNSKDKNLLLKNLDRQMDCYGHCIIVVDTEESGFRIKHINEAWEDVTGTRRDQVVGCRLSELVESRLGLPVLNDEHLAAVRDGREFTIRDVLIKCQTDGRMFSLSFRPASHAQLDDMAIPIGVPSSVPLGGAPSKLYFVAVQLIGDAQICSNSDRLSGTWSSVKLNSPGEKIEGLQLGHLLGKGAYASVFSAEWFGSSVAVRVIEQDPTRGDDTYSKCQEVALGLELRHPHIVSMLGHFVRKTARPQNDAAAEGGKALGDVSSAYTAKIQVAVEESLAPSSEDRSAPSTELSSSDAMLTVQTVQTVQSATVQPREATREYTPVSEVVQTWIIMEFCDKGSLQDALNQGWLHEPRSCLHGKANMEAVLATAVEVASALSYLHSQDVVHGDLSSWNILLTSSGATAEAGNRGYVAKIADFGLARVLGSTKTCVQTKSYGTLTHQAPEALVDGTVSTAVDVYAFGVLLWEMYTMSQPYRGLAHGQIVSKVVTEKAQLQWPAGTPLAYELLARICMSYDSQDRPSSLEVCRRLKDMQQSTESLAAGAV